MMMMTTTMMMTMNDGDDDGGMVGPGRMSLSHEEVFKMPPHDADSHLLQRGMEPRDGSCRSLKWSDSLVKMIWEFGLEPFSVCLPCYPWHTEIQGKLWAYLEWGEIALHGQPYREACSKRSHLAVSWQMEPQ